MQRIKYRGKNQIIKVNLRNDIDQSVWNEIYKHKEYRRIEMIIVKAKYPIMDIGAHAGFFSLYVTELNSQIDIFAFEPEKDNLIALKNNIQLNNFKNIKIIPLALAKNTAQRLFKITKDNHNHYLMNENEAEVNTKGRIINTISFSDFCQKYKLNKISLMKIDIEGGEYEIINSLNKNDYIKIQNIIMEYHNNKEYNYKQMEATLRQNGFGIQVFPSKFDKNMGFLFANNKRK